MELISIEDTAKTLNVSISTVYRYIKKKKVKYKSINDVKMVLVDSLKLLMINMNIPANHLVINDNQMIGDDNHSENNSSLNESIKDSLLSNDNQMIITILNSQIDKLERKNESLDKKNNELSERLITVEREQKKEIQQIHNSKDEQLKMYMELLKKQSDNLLEARPQHSHNPIDDSHDAEIIETTATRKRMKTKKFTKLMYEKGYTDKQIVKIIKKQIRKHDSRFEIIDGKTIIYKDKFTDL